MASGRSDRILLELALIRLGCGEERSIWVDVRGDWLGWRLDPERGRGVAAASARRSQNGCSAATSISATAASRSTAVAGLRHDGCFVVGLKTWV